jgi:hypothetical protein
MTALVNLRLAYGPKSRPATFEELSIPEIPKQTDSYVPVPHNQLVEMVKDELTNANLNVVQESHVLWRNGQRYFGLMQVNHPELHDADSAMIVGVRNSYDKSLPAMITSGNQVFVCDNLAFNGEIVLGRKHTKNIFDDLSNLVKGAMDVLFKHWKIHLSRIQSYKGFDLGDLQAHDLIAKSFLLGAIGKTQIADVIQQWHTPNHMEFNDRNLFRLHSAFTENWKGRLDLLPMNSRLLHSEFDKVAGFNPVTVEV